MIYRRFHHHPTMNVANVLDEFVRIRQELDNLFRSDASEHRLLGAGLFPQINLTEDTDKFYLKAELPGITPQDIQMQATAKTLSLSGERKISEKEGVRYHRRERESGKFSRIITLPSEIDPDRIEAKMEDGILSIHIPKSQAAKPRQITIQ